jgi:NAD(P)-dependent dehydrogenase (short-subunit alcohol dehydrogenase family)
VTGRVFATDLLAGEVAVVTGGAAGIGLAVAVRLAACGCDVVIAGRSADRLSEAVNAVAAATGRRCTALVCDVRDERAVARLRTQTIDRYGPATIVVNNAAVNFAMAAERMTKPALLSVLDTDLVGTFNVTRTFVTDLIEAGGGAVLNMALPEAERGFPGYAHCGAAKAGVLSMTRTWAREWGRYGVRVNAIGPGTVPTVGAAANMPGLADGRDRHDVGRIALRRLGTPDEVALAAVFLCSGAASYITGAVLHVDGGLNIA